MFTLGVRARSGTVTLDNVKIRYAKTGVVVSEKGKATIFRTHIDTYRNGIVVSRSHADIKDSSITLRNGKEGEVVSKLVMTSTSKVAGSLPIV